VILPVAGLLRTPVRAGNLAKPDDPNRAVFCRYFSFFEPFAGEDWDSAALVIPSRESRGVLLRIPPNIFAGVVLVICNW